MGLESMIVNPRPTRAECSDVANAVLDGTDAVMLSGETANGEHPTAAVSIMARTCVEAESATNFSSLYQAIRNSTLKRYCHINTSESIASSAVKTAIDVNAKAIIVMSESGNTARQVAKFRPGMPIKVVTTSAQVARQCFGTLKGCSASTHVRAIIDTAAVGCSPFAVSPESMTASVPSSTALATSEHSARVGRGLTIIDSSICVAVMTGLPAMLASRIIIFWARKTFSGGISIPKSPRATMIPSVTFKISS